MWASIHINMANHFGALKGFKPRFVHHSTPIGNKAGAQLIILGQAN